MYNIMYMLPATFYFNTLTMLRGAQTLYVHIRARHPEGKCSVCTVQVDGPAGSL